MSSTSRKATMAVSLLLIFSVLQISLRVSLAVTGAEGRDAAAQAQTDGLSGKLSIRGNQPVMVNGSSAPAGTTIFSGATLETPGGVEAGVNLGPLGSLELSSNTIAKLDFSDGNVRVMLIKGCVILRTKKNTTGTVETARGVIGTTDKERDGKIDVCDPERALPPTTGGTGVGTGVGTTGGGIGTAAGAAIGGAGLIALLTTALVIEPCGRGTDSSLVVPGGQTDNCR